MAANSLRPGPVVQGDRRWFGGSRWFGSKVSSEKVSTNINNSRSMLSVFQLCKRFKRGHKLRAPPPGAALARQRHHVRAAPDILTSAANRSIGSTTGCTITEKAPTRTSLVSYSRPSLVIIASRTQFHVERPWGQRPFSIVSQ